MTDDDKVMKAAQDKLDETIAEFLKTFGLEGIVTSYMLVAHVSLPPDDDGDDRSSYPLVFQGGSVPDHVAEGLLAVAKEKLRIGRMEAGWE